MEWPNGEWVTNLDGKETIKGVFFATYHKNERLSFTEGLYFWSGRPHEVIFSKNDYWFMSSVRKATPEEISKFKQEYIMQELEK